MLSQIIAARQGMNPEDSAAEAQTWEKLYVGDEFAKDVVGARNSGWKAALLAGDESQEAADDDAPELEEHPGASFHELFSRHDFVTIRSIQNLVNWVRSEEGVGYPT
jgi:FMN phosphatase YigB (HAD superfamily)